MGRNKVIREVWFFLAAALVVAADQVSKYFVRANMSLGQSIPENGFFRFTYGTNTGGVWGWLIVLMSRNSMRSLTVALRLPNLPAKY